MEWEAKIGGGYVDCSDFSFGIVNVSMRCFRLTSRGASESASFREASLVFARVPTLVKSVLEWATPAYFPIPVRLIFCCIAKALSWTVISPVKVPVLFG
jgi:hypothetical protein